MISLSPGLHPLPHLHPRLIVWERKLEEPVTVRLSCSSVLSNPSRELITFWDSCKAAIHDNSSLSDIDKSLLQGPALDAMSGLTLTAVNYKEAVSVLRNQFGNKQHIVSKHMDLLLLNIEPVTSSYNLKDSCMIPLSHMYKDCNLSVCHPTLMEVFYPRSSSGSLTQTHHQQRVGEWRLEAGSTLGDWNSSERKSE